MDGVYPSKSMNIHEFDGYPYLPRKEVDDG
jgi:hypothetical protein